MNTKPIPVTWQRSDELRCVELGARGLTTDAIARNTGLTPCQVTYRLNKANIKRSDYRNGRNLLAQQTISQTWQMTTADIRQQLKLRIIKRRMPVRGFEK